MSVFDTPLEDEPRSYDPVLRPARNLWDWDLLDAAPRVRQLPAPQVPIRPLPEPPSIPTPQPVRSPFEQAMGLIDRFHQYEEQAQEAKKAKTLDEALAEVRRLREMRAAAPPSGPAPSPTDAPDTAGWPGADPTGYREKNAQFESAGNWSAVNPGSGAGGRYQFLRSTWDEFAKNFPHLGLTPEGRTSASPEGRRQQNAAMDQYTKLSEQRLTPLLKRKPTAGELYALHLLGHSGGSHMIEAQHAPLTSTVRADAISGNPWLKQFATGRDLLAYLNRKFG